MSGACSSRLPELPVEPPFSSSDLEGLPLTVANTIRVERSTSVRVMEFVAVMVMSAPSVVN